MITRIAEPLLYKPPLKYLVTPKSQNVVVKVVTDQEIEGFGAASPPRMVTGETVDTILNALDKIGPKIIGMGGSSVQENVELVDDIISGNSSAKAALDMAFHDILGKATGKPLYALLGNFRRRVITDKSLGIKSAKEMVRDAIKAVKDGFDTIKIKTGTNPREDVKKVGLIRRAVGGDIQIRIDVNQGWTLQQAIECLRKIEEFDIQFVEQPINAQDIRGMKEIRHCSSIPIMADESVASPEDASRVIKAEAADLINIKLMKSGGIWKARKIAAIAEAAGIQCMIGCGTESEIGLAAGTHFAAATRNVPYADLDSDTLLRDRLVTKGGTVLEKSLRKLPETPGLGIERLDTKLLGKPIRTYK